MLTKTQLVQRLLPFVLLIEVGCYVVVQDSFSELLEGDQASNDDPVMNFPP